MSAFGAKQLPLDTLSETVDMIRALEDEWTPVFNKANKKYTIDLKQEDLICPVCSEKFEDPRLMPCLHTFCMRCIKAFQSFHKKGRGMSASMMDLSSVGRKGLGPICDLDFRVSSSNLIPNPFTKRAVICPICDTEVDIPQDVSKLPKNFIISKLQLAALVENKGSGCFCDSCTIDQSNNGATARCLTCNENLCYLCVLAHCRQKRTITHQLVEFDDPKFAQKICQTNTHTLCSTHRDKTVEMYCSQCKEVICQLCMSFHRGHICESIQNTSSENRETLRLLMNKLTPNLSEIDNALLFVSDNQDLLKTKARQVEKDINVYLDNYTKSIQKHRRNLVRQLNIILNEKEQKLHFQRVCLEQMKKNIKNSCNVVSGSLKYSNQVELMSVKSILEDRLSYLNKLHVSNKTGVDDFMAFVPEMQAEVIDDFQMFGGVTGQRPSPEKSYIKSEDLNTSRVDHTSVVILTVVDGDGTPMRNAASKTKAWLKCVSTGDRKLDVSIDERKDGSLSLPFTPSLEGAHQLRVQISGKDIQGSPFTFNVKPKWRKHSGQWHCCTFCSSGGKKDVRCACGGTMPGGFLGCGHGHLNHPGGYHWSCCGKLTEKSECFLTSRQSPVRQVTL